MTAAKIPSPFAPPPAAPPPRRRDWAPRFWEGSDFVSWLRLLARNKFQVEFPYWYIAGIVSGVSFGHMVLRWLHDGLHGDRIAATPVRTPPVFVIGHWRTGTTLLHELAILDDRFTCPDTYACFDPSHVLLSERFIKTYGKWLMPDRRPMDNMAAGWDRPQECEFALCLLGMPSTYADIAFPNRPTVGTGALDLSGLSAGELAKWKRTFRRYLQMLTVQEEERTRDRVRAGVGEPAPRRLVLKSPPHTARVKVLLEMFPGAKFVHIVRDPYVVFPSTVNLWLSMARKHGFQTPRGGPALEEKVFAEFRVIYDRLEEAKPLIPAGQFFEVRYEDLARDPVGGMEKVYAGLDLGGFDAVRPKLEDYAARTAGYETNKFQLTADQRAEVTRRWGDVIRRYGYG